MDPVFIFYKDVVLDGLQCIKTTAHAMPPAECRQLELQINVCPRFRIWIVYDAWKNGVFEFYMYSAVNRKTVQASEPPEEIAMYLLLAGDSIHE